MPFIDSDFLLDERKIISRLLITCADDSDVTKLSFDLAKLWKSKGYSVLLVDGNFGERLLAGATENPEVEKILLGQQPLTQAIQEINGISVLTGISNPFLAELDEIAQYQFLQDLIRIYPNYDKVILTVDGKNAVLQQKWMQHAENIYLLFHAKNVFFGRTATWLQEHPNKANGLIGIGKNEQDVLLAYIRLKELLGDVPDLIFDIQKIAP